MPRVKEDLVKILLLLFDFAISSAILMLSIFIKGELGKYGLLSIKPNEGDYFLKIWWVSVVLVAIFFIKGLYSKRLPFWSESKEIFSSVFFTVLVSLSLIYMQKMWNFPRSIFIIYFSLAVIVVPIVRHWFKLFLLKIGLYGRSMLVVGAGSSAKGAVSSILKQKEFGMTIIGFLDDFKKGNIEIDNKEFKIIGKVSDLESVIDKLNVDSVMIAMPSVGSEKIADLVSKVQLLVRRVYVIPELKGVAVSNVQIYPLFDEQMFVLRVNNNLMNLKNKILKGVFDFTVSLAILPVLAITTFVFGFLIKIDSKGPVFFIQNRVGRKGKLFRCIKFRTMFVNSDEILNRYLEENPKVRDEWKRYKKIKGYDPRITRVGKFLRKTSLDELPQIFNVLLGQMSLVGPRPYLPKELEEMGKYKGIILESKPGITGLWQVSGRNKLSFEKRVELDSWYVLNWSLWLDIVILIKTVKAVLKKEGAY
ncbi:sugar transferase [Hippea alviniae]|uniref:sugar transferase n=1 Tax=Hippea alviniae TaxID=1279027 RepID=UPI0003B3C3B1|nr:sugar transferase [Hippea alviniae]